MSDKRTELFLTPAEGLRVIDPATGAPLPPKGAFVVGNEVYWRRRLNDGDVTESRKPASTSATKSQET